MVIKIRALSALEHRPRPRRPRVTEEDSPSCRICFGGVDCGRLISPCLCCLSLLALKDELRHW